MTCLAVWPDDRDASQTFIVGTLDFPYRRTAEERVRCFLLRRSPAGSAVMAQSSDATCHGGLTSPEQGFQTFQFTSGGGGGPAAAVTGNLFPIWTVPLRRLTTFDFTKLYSLSADQSEWLVSNYSYARGAGGAEARVTVVQVLQSTHSRVKMITRTVSDCEQQYHCTVLYRRTDSILQLEQGKDLQDLLHAQSGLLTYSPSAPSVSLN